MNWKKLYFGHINRQEIKKAINDNTWQRLRLDLKGRDLINKYYRLLYYLERNNFNKKAKIQVTNYVTALSRGGLIRVSDYKGGE